MARGTRNKCLSSELRIDSRSIRATKAYYQDPSLPFIYNKEEAAWMIYFEYLSKETRVLFYFDKEDRE